MRYNKKSWVILLSSLLSVLSGYNQVKLPGIFGDHMVLQRNQQIPVWGWSSPNEKVIVKFNHQLKTTKADHYGRWKLSLQPEPAGGPFEFSVQGKNSITYHDVMVGEVWLCSGQSNMEFELKSALNAAVEIQTAQYPDIRQIKVVSSVSTTPKEDIQSSTWDVCNEKTAGNFTAVGFFFAREMVKKLHIPIGLINSTWGGTMIETWTSRRAFENSREFKAMIDSMPESGLDAMITERRHRLSQLLRLYQQCIGDTSAEENWKTLNYDSRLWPKIRVAVSWENQNLGLQELDGIVWYIKEVELDRGVEDERVTLSLGTIDDIDDTYVNGVWVGSTKHWTESRIYQVPAGIFKSGKNIIAVRVEDKGGGGGFYGDSSLLQIRTEKRTIPIGESWRFRIAKTSDNGKAMGPNDSPTLLFNAMIHPLIPFSIRGVLWYQGENNADRAYQYRSAFPLMIADWRTHWGEGDFPFYFVQLASFNSANGNSQTGSKWAELREAQSQTLAVPSTGMAVAIDIGDSNDIHPKNKQDVGRRLASIAFNNIYGQTMEYSGPMYHSMKTDGDKIILSFTHAASGLKAEDKYGYIKGFEIAGSDRFFYYAKAYIKDNKVFVYCNEVTQPVAVRYAWADYAGDANLFNQEGFPAVPFRTDQWKGKTDDIKFELGK